MRGTKPTDGFGQGLTTEFQSDVEASDLGDHSASLRRVQQDVFWLNIAEEKRKGETKREQRRRGGNRWTKS
jgi:hypothetical protein